MFSQLLAQLWRPLEFACLIALAMAAMHFGKDDENH